MAQIGNDNSSAVVGLRGYVSTVERMTCVSYGKYLRRYVCKTETLEDRPTNTKLDAVDFCGQEHPLCQN